ncbi:MAG: type II secretion system protein [Patescibacteria group bacterium]
MKKLLSKFSSVKGFTLIELLIVIAILGVLATVLIALLDPGDKIKSANDTRALQDIREIYGANQRYMAQNNSTVGGSGASGTLVTGGELKAWPAPATGSYTYVANTGGTDAVVGGEILSKSARSKSTTSNTIGTSPAAACVTTGATGTCYFLITGNKSCYKYNVTPATAIPAAADVCP